MAAPWTASAVTAASSVKHAVSAPVAASQTRAVLSSEAVTMRAPSGENAARHCQSKPA